MSLVKPMRWGTVIGILICMATLLTACFQKETSYKIGEGFYSFDATTVLSTLDSGQSLHVEMIKPTPPPMSEPVRWSEEDFFKVASKVMPPEWKKDSMLRSLGFHFLPCQDIQAGPQGMVIDFYKMVGEVRSEFQVAIEARAGYVSWGQVDYHPTQHARPVYSPIELPKLKVHTLDALRLAEEQGGKEYRLRVNNDCEISGGLVVDVWTIWYYGPKGTEVYRVDIDARTGAIQPTPSK